ncbi:MAG: hypothetical protein JWM98_1647, partial [Thermoleophilia bacterium]|nr:hypothetical protein [Thermoleophilia bacterium]
MAHRPTSLLALVLVFVLVAPSAASACAFPIRRIGPIDVLAKEIRRPVRRTVERAEWGFAPDVMALRPRLSQFVLTKQHTVYYGATYAKQRAISIDVAGPDD